MFAMFSVHNTIHNTTEYSIHNRVVNIPFDHSLHVFIIEDKLHINIGLRETNTETNISFDLLLNQMKSISSHMKSYEL